MKKTSTNYYLSIKCRVKYNLYFKFIGKKKIQQLENLNSHRNVILDNNIIFYSL